MLHDTTGALSEEFFMYLLESEGKRAVRFAEFFSILTVEIDQPENGELLATLAKLIREKIRTSDQVGRIEQQRFSVILHLAEAADTYNVGERIRVRVENHNFELRHEQVRKTVSIGVACFPSHTPDPQGLLLTANEMLKRAKSMGGNKTILPEI